MVVSGLHQGAEPAGVRLGVGVQAGEELRPARLRHPVVGDGEAEVAAHVAQAEARVGQAQGGGGPVGRAVVGDHALEAGERRPRQGVQARLQEGAGLVGHDAHGHSRRGGRHGRA